MSFLDEHLLQLRDGNVEAFIRMQHCDIENLLKLHGLRSAPHRRGHRNFRDFRDDRLLLKSKQSKQDSVPLFSHLQHRSIESQDELVADACVLRPRPSRRPAIVREELKKKTRQVPPWCWCLSSGAVGRRSWCPPEATCPILWSPCKNVNSPHALA